MNAALLAVWAVTDTAMSGAALYLAISNRRRDRVTSYRDRRLAGVHTDGSAAFLKDRGLEPAPKQAKEQLGKSTSTTKRGPNAGKH